MQPTPPTDASPLLRLLPTPEQELLAQTAQAFARDHSPVERRRHPPRGVGFDQEVWSKMAEMGWLGLTLPEELGGLELGLSELSPILQAMGAQLAVEPLIPALLAAHILLEGANPEQKERWLPPLASGKSLLTAAWHEPHSRYRLQRIHTTAAPSPRGGFTLHGVKTQVQAASASERIIVSALTDHTPALSLFLVDPKAPGVTLSPASRIDGQVCFHLHLQQVQVPASALIGPFGGGQPFLERAMDIATVALCAEMLGATQRAFDLTLDYLKTRRQFDAPIGSFQALQHRAGRMFVALQVARSATLAATAAADQQPHLLPLYASLAKARLATTALHIANEGVQMHGGVGVTNEYDIGLYLKHARASAPMFGDASWHMDRWASLSGF